LRPTGAGSTPEADVVLDHTEVTVEWQGPSAGLQLEAPASVNLGQDIPVRITLTNTSPSESRTQTVRIFLPEGLQHLRSEPPGIVEGMQLLWTLGALGAGQSRTLEATFRAPRVGAFPQRVQVTTEEGVRDEKTATTQVVSPALQLTVSGPPLGAVGVPFACEITVMNPGTAPATKVGLKASLDPGLEHDAKVNQLELSLGTLDAGAKRSVHLTLTPRQAGALAARLEATADGNLRDQGQHAVNVVDAKLNVKIAGPATRYAGRPASWELLVSNPGPLVLQDVTLRDVLPPELEFTSATEGG